MRGKLMKMLPASEHKRILNANPDNKDAVVEYSGILNLTVSRQLVQYWRKVFVTDGTLVKANTRIIAGRKHLKPSKEDDIGKLPDLNKVYHCIGVIPDQHEPYGHPDTIPFLTAVKAAFKPDLWVNLGDEQDGHAMSFHDSDPNLDSAGPELVRAQKACLKLAKLIPTQLVCDSNHGSLVYRKAKHHGLPAAAIKKYRDILFPDGGGAGWSWASRWIVRTPLGDVMFKHQAGNPLAEAAHQRCNLVVGHNHSKFEVAYKASQDYLYWAATCGCLVDNESLAFAYGKDFPHKPIVGMVVIMEGRPILVPMVLNSKGRWIGRL